MLQISDGAVRLLQETRSEQGVPESYGLRVFGRSDQTGGIQVHLTFTEEPEEGDQVIEQAGTELYLAPEVAEPLDNAVLDVADEEAGPELVLRQQ